MPRALNIELLHFEQSTEFTRPLPSCIIGRRRPLPLTPNALPTAMLLKPLGCIPLLKPIAARSLHLGVRIALARRGILPHTELQRATFCTTPRRCATEDNKPNPYKTEFWQMIEQTMKERPELKQQFMELHQELKAAGIDVTSRPLSRQEMLALLFKPKIYELLLKMSASFQELGMDRKKMMDTLMKAVSDEEPPSQK